MRKFIISYPNWNKWGIAPARGFFTNFTDIAADWFQSSTDVAQLALQMTGSNIIRTSTDPVWQPYIDGSKIITRQMNFMLNVLQFSGVSGQRADTNEFLLDFIEWVDEENIMRRTPLFGDDHQMERTWATNGGFVAEWDGQQPASVYAIQIHQYYSKKYEAVFE